MTVSKELGDQSKVALAWKKSDVLTIKLPFKRNGLTLKKNLSILCQTEREIGHCFP